MKSISPMARLRRRAALFLFCAPILLAAGCGGGNGSGTNPVPGWQVLRTVPPSPVRKWTVLVFLNAANNLEEFSGLNINQMEQVGSTDSVNVVVQIKRIANRYDDSFTDWEDTATRRMLIARDSNTSHIASPVLEQNDLLDMGTPDAVQDFVRWGVRNFPAERYCLVLWNHGAGWRTVPVGEGARRGVSYDDVTGSHVNTIDLPAAIDLGGGRKWDLLAFDASLMQMAEVAHEIRDKTRYIAGSEESPSGEGYPYDTILTKLVQNPDMDGRALGVTITQDMLTYYGAGSNVTQSVLDASKIGAVTSAVNALGRALLDAKGTYGSEIVEARSLSESYTYPENRDLMDFAQLLSAIPTGGSAPRVPDPAVIAAAQNVESALRAAIVLNINGRQHSHSNGLAIFLPSPTQYQTIDLSQSRGFGQRYTSLAFAADAPNWQAFLVQGPR